jgi:curved DNA-binding protein CbpA
LEALRVEIAHKAATVDTEDYFTMLGVAEDAGPDQIRGAFFGLAKTWHPDRQPSELVDLKPQVARVFSRLSEAYQTLVDPAKNKEYAKLLHQVAASPAEKDQVARVVDAVMAFQKAEILLKKHDPAGAEQFALAAAEIDPDQPEYRVLLAWIRAERRVEAAQGEDGATSVKYDDIIKVLDDVLKADPSFERALFYRGLLLKRSGLPDKAYRDFRKAAELNPKNIDAVREVRLHQMRLRTTPPTPPTSAGILGKFWKR